MFVRDMADGDAADFNVRTDREAADAGELRPERIAARTHGARAAKRVDQEYRRDDEDRETGEKFGQLTGH